MGGVLDERMVKVNHANEPFEGLNIERLGVVMDGLDLCWQRSNSILVNPVAKEIDFWHPELALVKLDY